jgi:hypothetical protein
MSLLPKVRKIKDLETMQRVLAAARSDNDGCSYPSHYVEKNGEIVGCASVASVPVLMLWHDSKKIGPKESMQLQNTYETLIEEKGVPGYIIMCNKESPYHGHMQKFGYQPVWETDIFVKELNL